MSTHRVPPQTRNTTTRTPARTVPTAGRPLVPAPRAPGRQLLSVTEAAERLGTPERFIRRLIAQRRIRFYKVGRYIRFDATDLDNFVETGRVEPWL
jgi:excisionase family DNA binding protein